MNIYLIGVVLTIYCGLQIIGIVAFQNSKSNCQISDHEPNFINTRDTHFACFISVLICCILNRQMLQQHGRDFKEYLGIFLIYFICGSSEFISFSQVYNSSCHLIDDVYGTHSTVSQWIEWSVTLPLMVYLGCKLEFPERLEWFDRLLTIFSGLIIVFACLSSVQTQTQTQTQTTMHTYNKLWIILSWGMYGIVSFMIFFKERIQNVIRSNKYLRCFIFLCDKQDKFESYLDDEYQELMDKSRLLKNKRDKLHHLMFEYLFPIFPIIFILDYGNWIGPDFVEVLYSFSSLVTKLIYCSHLLNEKLKFDQEIQKQQELRQTENEHRALIANVAHDLKTPLAGVMTATQILEIDFEQLLKMINQQLENQNSTVHPFLQQMKTDIQSFATSTEQIYSMNTFMIMSINRCLDTAKSQRGLKLLPKSETFSLQKAVSIAFLCMKSCDKSEQIQVKMNTIPGDICPFIISDHQWIHENVLCLLSNAVKYSHHGTVELGVKLLKRSSTPKHHKNDKLSPTQKHHETLNCDQLCLYFEVKDQGIGVNENAMKKLFNPFQQAQKMAGGTGLGLYSLSKRIEALDGKYGVFNRTDGLKGSVFWFTVPYSPDWDHQSFVSTTCNNFKDIHLLSTSPELTKRSTLVEKNDDDDDDDDEFSLSVLVVDDSLSIQKMISKLLEKCGYNVVVVSDGQKAIDMIEKTKITGSIQFDFILMDFQMPTMDGFEATRRIRQFEQEYFELSGINVKHFIIGSSANSDEQSIIEATDIGFDDVIPKPITKAKLEEVLIRNGIAVNNVVCVNKNIVNNHQNQQVNTQENPPFHKPNLHVNI